MWSKKTCRTFWTRHKVRNPLTTFKEREEEEKETGTREMFYSFSASHCVTIVLFFFFLLSFAGEKECFRDTVVQKYVNVEFLFKCIVKCIVKLFYLRDKAKGKEKAQKVEKYLCEERNPVSVVAYYIVVLIGYVLALDFFSGFRNSGDERRSKLGDDAQRELYWFTFHAILGIITHIIVLTSDPGIVTEKNHRLCYKMFPFDDLLYEEGNTCRTLNIDIPARSKWDVVTNRRVCKFDHYCAVVNQTIGLRNLRWFLLYLIVNGVLCIHGGFVCWNQVMRKVPSYWHRAKEGDFYGTFLPALMYHHTRSIFSMFVLFSVGFGVLGFTLYHFYLVLTNVTTNETYKYAHIRQVNKRLPKDERVAAVNIWNRGIVSNLKEVLFPMRVY